MFCILIILQVDPVTSCQQNSSVQAETAAPSTGQIGKKETMLDCEDFTLLGLINRKIATFEILFFLLNLPKSTPHISSLPRVRFEPLTFGSSIM